MAYATRFDYRSYASDFTVMTIPTPTVAAGGQSTFTVLFNPSAPGLRTATISIANNDSNENPYDFVIQGTGIDLSDSEILIYGAESNLEMSDGDTTPGIDDADFGFTDISGGVLSRTFVIANLGTDALHLTGAPRVSITGPNATDFSVSVAPTSTVTAGGETTFTIEFDPSANGLRTATVSIANDDANENPYDFVIQGTGSDLPSEMLVFGVESNLEIPDGDTTPGVNDFDFGSTDVDGFRSRTFVIANLGPGVLNLTGAPRVSITGPEAFAFRVTFSPSATINVGDSTAFVIEFDPYFVGLHAAKISIANDDPNENPYNFVIQGTGVELDAEIFVYGLEFNLEIFDGDTTLGNDDTDFGAVAIVGGTRNRTFVIANLGPGVLNLLLPRIEISGPGAAAFHALDAIPWIAPGGQIHLTVTFDPSVVGLHTADVTTAHKLRKLVNAECGVVPPLAPRRGR